MLLASCEKVARCTGSMQCKRCAACSGRGYCRVLLHPACDWLAGEARENARASSIHRGIAISNGSRYEGIKVRYGRALGRCEGCLPLQLHVPINLATPQTSPSPWPPAPDSSHQQHPLPSISQTARTTSPPPFPSPPGSSQAAWVLRCLPHYTSVQ